MEIIIPPNINIVNWDQNISDLRCTLKKIVLGRVSSLSLHVNSFFILALCVFVVIHYNNVEILSDCATVELFYAFSDLWAVAIYDISAKIESVCYPGTTWRSLEKLDNWELRVLANGQWYKGLQCVPVSVCGFFPISVDVNYCNVRMMALQAVETKLRECKMVRLSKEMAM